MTTDPSQAIGRAKEHLEKGELELAERAFREVLSADPEDGAARIGLTQLLVRLGRKQEAVEQCEIVASLYSKLGRHDRAAEVYGRILKIDPDRPEAREKLGELLHRLGDREEALWELAAAAAAYGSRKDDTGKLRVLQSLMALTPEEKRGPVRLDYADTLAQAGKSEEALVELREEAARLEAPGALSILTGRGTAEGTKTYRTLLELLQRIVALDPADLDALVRLGRYQVAGRPSAAIATLHAALKLDRTCIPAIRLIDHAFLALGQYERAVVSFDEIKRIDPETFSTDPGWREEPGPMGPGLVMVDVLLQGNRPDEALDHARAIIEKRPGSIPGRMKLKDVYVALGNVDAAVNEIGLAVGLALEAGDAGLGREILQDALRLAPSHARVRELSVRVSEQLSLV